MLVYSEICSDPLFNGIEFALFKVCSLNNFVKVTEPIKSLNIFMLNFLISVEGVFKTGGVQGWLSYGSIFLVVAWLCGAIMRGGLCDNHCTSGSLKTFTLFALYSKLFGPIDYHSVGSSCRFRHTGMHWGCLNCSHWWSPALVNIAIHEQWQLCFVLNYEHFSISPT